MNMRIQDEQDEFTCTVTLEIIRFFAATFIEDKVNLLTTENS